MESNQTKVWKYQSKEQEALALHILSLEKGALDKWFNGDTSGYSNLWSHKDLQAKFLTFLAA